MTTFIKKIAVLAALLVCANLVANAKDYIIGFSCDPDEAAVFVNGRQVAESTPAMVKISDKEATKTMMVQFKKDGYKSKTVTVSFSKKELKNNPIVYGQLKKLETKASANAAAANAKSSSDPTLTNGQLNQRVDCNSAGKTDMERSIIRWYFDSDPRGARVFWRVISSVPAEVKNTNETYLMTTPFEETRGFNINGLTYDNSRDVTIEIKLTKRGYEDQIKRFNVRQCLDQQEISGFFELVPKEQEHQASVARSKKTKTVTVTEEETEE